MKTLILLRHAKSDWHTPFQSDHERKLNKRGRRNAPLMGAFMAAKGYIPDAIKCSTAARAKETCALVLEGLGTDIKVEFVDTLYGANEQELLKEARSSNEGSRSLLLIAHNPGLRACVMDLVTDIADDMAFEKLDNNFPTAALAVLEFDVDRWQDIAFHSGRLVCFQVPREL
jgi:phosphohistidine phosphatase